MSTRWPTTFDTINDAATMAVGTGALLAGRYLVVRQLGQGGMGSVWLAEDTQLDNKLFAIKMLPSILVSKRRAFRQLKDEALVAMKLTYTNIVTLRAFEENHGNPFLVMDYIDGQTLDDYLAEEGKLTEDETLRVLRPIAVSLDYAHAKGVVHRDVKPSNVMIAKDGTPYILDFGIAREIKETVTRVTGRFSSGTLMYMSPEQNNGAEPTPAQDVYSFAAMVYECLAGKPPFSRGNIEYQIMNTAPAPLPPEVPCSCAAAIMAGLAKKPENRPPTCAAVLGCEHPPHNEAATQFDTVTGRVAASTGTVSVHGKVQLWEGGPYWAETNIGAEKPEDYGFYFWWGDTVGYKREGDAWVASDGSSSDFEFAEGHTPTWGKSLFTLKSEGWIIEGEERKSLLGKLFGSREEDSVLTTKHDAAQVHWGGEWRMPTKQELKDLCSKCDWTWTTMNGVNGYVVCGRGNYASASIFLPCAGFGHGVSFGHAGSTGAYWAAVPYSDYNDSEAWDFVFNSGSHAASFYYRFYGQPIRPVQGIPK